MIAVAMLCKREASTKDGPGRPGYVQKFAFIECFMVKDAQRIAARHWKPLTDTDYSDFVVLAYDLDEGMGHLRYGDAYLSFYDPTMPKQ